MIVELRPYKSIAAAFVVREETVSPSANPLATPYGQLLLDLQEQITKQVCRFCFSQCMHPVI